MGFSAGGHLASSAATLFEPGRAGDPDPVERLGSGDPALFTWKDRLLDWLRGSGFLTGPAEHRP